MRPLAVGAPAPAITLRSQFGEDVSLGTLAARGPVLLVFYPFAFSSICTGELQSIRDAGAQFSDAGLQVVGLSCDPMFTQRAWADAEGFDFPLLSDFWPHGATAAAYGVFDEASGFAGRGTFLVDCDMTVRWTLVNGPGQARDFTEALAAAASL